jgi:hypothetical protein
MVPQFRRSQALFYGRVLYFDDPAALIWARPMSQGTVEGHPRSGFDLVVAAIAVANDCIVVTDNEETLSGCEVTESASRCHPTEVCCARHSIPEKAWLSPTSTSH